MVFNYSSFIFLFKKEQEDRFKSRETDPLKQYKLSPVDKQAQELWDQYSIRKFEMLNATNRTLTPWTIIRSDDKKKARLNCIRTILLNVDYEGKINDKKLKYDPEIVISGIDEIKIMEENLLNPALLPG